MKFIAEKNPEISLTLDGKVRICFITSRNALVELETLKDNDLVVEVKKHSLKRSLSQNAYMWVLLGELAKKLHLSNVNVYKNYIKDYGIYETLLIQNKAVDHFIKAWSDKGLGWVAEIARDGKIKGCSVVLAYYGSSTYDRPTMNRLLETIIDDCQEQGIATMTANEIALLKNENDKKVVANKN